LDEDLQEMLINFMHLIQDVVAKPGIADWNQKITAKAIASQAGINEVVL
jgi:hypothetical protein